MLPHCSSGYWFGNECLLPSDSSLSHIPTLVHSATDSDPVFASTPPSVSSTLLPSVFSTPPHTSSLAPSAVDEDPEILSMFPLPLFAPTPFSMPMSDFEYLPSATIDQLAPTLSSTPLSSSPISPMFLSSVTEDQSEPEPAPALFASVPTLPFTSLHIHSTADNDSIFASTPPSLSPPSSTFLPSLAQSAMNSQPESEHKAASTSISVPLLSLPLSTLHPLSLLSSTFLPSPVILTTDPESEPASTSEFSKFGLSPHPLSLPPDQTLAHLQVSSLTLSSSRSSEISMLDSMLAAPPPNQPSFSLGSLSQLSRSRELESSTSSSTVDVAMLSYSESSLSSQNEPIPFLPSSLEAQPITPISMDSVATPVNVTPSLTSPAIPFILQLQELPTVHEVPSTLAPRFPLASPPLLLSHSGLVRFSFAFVFFTVAALVSTFFNVSAALLTYTRKFRGKQDINDIRIDTLKASSCDGFTHQLRLGQYTPRALRFVFDPGGLAWVFKLTQRTRRHSQVQPEVTRCHGTTCGHLLYGDDYLTIVSHVRDGTMTHY
ncbi:hypothetical protein EDB85DRAFT_2222047 [Lactarius pseudohatsudake]|nr:hypothetical protein EDB85DRAFT_2222047 [Lactarius pseudohatsudake]